VDGGSAESTGSDWELCQHVDADGRSLVEARDVLTRWASAAGMPAELRDDMVLAAYEAMANAAEHGYRGQGGVIEVHANRTDDSVVVTVADRGEWRPPPADNGFRGRGLRLIEALSQRSAVIPARTGTTVVMTWPVAPDPH
jgi:serine/threonine-protein kinase RsbW